MDNYFKTCFNGNEIIIVSPNRTKAVCYCFKTWGFNNAPYDVTEMLSEDYVRKFLSEGGQLIYSDNRDTQFNILKMVI